MMIVALNRRNHSLEGRVEDLAGLFRVANG